MGSTRLERVGELLKQEIGTLFARGMKDPRIGLVTITGVRVSPDLREAWVYYSVLGDEQARAETARGIAAARGYIRREVGHNVKLRVTPDLHFVFDESIERGDRIERLLREVREQDEMRSMGEAENDVEKKD